MSETLEISKTIPKGDILAFEKALASHPNAVFGDSDVCPLTHTFSDGIYMREMFIPAGTTIVGKAHKKEHIALLLDGAINIATEEGVKTLYSPCYFVSKAGVKRVGFALTDVRFINIHPNPTNTQDLDEIEEEVIEESYGELHGIDEEFLIK